MARVVRGAWGALLLIDPGWPLRVGGGRDTPGVRAGVRVLGARHLAETLVLSTAHDERPRHWILAIDAVHGASMLGLAAASPRLRRDALLSAASASALVLLSALER
jgi:hypothetical protein